MEPNRWTIAIAGVVMQIALGAVYAWSVFRTPLATQFNWTIAEVTLTFTISIFVLGFAAFPGGLWLNRKGPRVVAVTGGILYGLGVFLAGFTNSLWWLYLTYGLIGGIGWASIHRSGGRAVKWFRSSRLDHRNRRRRFWRRRAGDGANRHEPHRERWRAQDVFLSRARVSRRHASGWLFMRNPPRLARGMAPAPAGRRTRGTRFRSAGPCARQW